MSRSFITVSKSVQAIMNGYPVRLRKGFKCNIAMIRKMSTNIKGSKGQVLLFPSFHVCWP